MNPQEMLPRLTGLFGPEIAARLVQIAMDHKVSGERWERIPSHIIVRLMEEVCA